MKTKLYTDNKAMIVKDEASEMMEAAKGCNINPETIDEILSDKLGLFDTFFTIWILLRLWFLWFFWFLRFFGLFWFFWLFWLLRLLRFLRLLKLRLLRLRHLKAPNPHLKTKTRRWSSLL